MGVAPDIEDQDAETLGSAALRVLLALVAREPDEAERAARLAILRADGHLPEGRRAA